MNVVTVLTLELSEVNPVVCLGTPHIQMAVGFTLVGIAVLRVIDVTECCNGRHRTFDIYACAVSTRKQLIRP